ncbi:MAG TPA: PAS domain S-box protein, partial [Opitutales bacterium]|nr:PAS domain S-box protein [Opitutales bacterium]
MSSSLTIRHQAKYVSLSQAAGVLVSVAGGLVILGWVMDISWLKSIYPGWSVMKVNTAGSFILCGISLVLQGYEQPGKARRRVGRACAAIVLVVVLLTLGEYLTQTNFGLDQLLIKQMPGATPDAHPGRMSLAAVVGFICVSLALLELDWKLRNGIRPSQALALLAGLIGQFAFAGYLFGVQSPFANSPFSTMAIHTSVLLLVLSLGLLVARPGVGFLGTLTSEGIGGVLARRLLPLAIILPLGIGWLRLQGQLAGYYGLEFGLALFATCNIFVFFGLIWCAAYWLNRAEAERQLVELAVREGQLQVKSIIDSAMDAIITVDETQKIVLFNAAAEKMFGCVGTEALGQPLERFIPARFRESHARHVESFGQTGETGRAMGKLGDIHGLRANGEEFPIEASISHTTSGNKKFFTVILRDITMRKRDEEVHARLAAIVEHSDDAIIGKNLEGIITSWNRGAEHLLGYTAEEITGQSVTLLIPPERRDEEKAILTRLKRGEHIRHYETVRRRKDGSLVELSLTISPLLDSHGRMVGASKIARDITER